MMAHAQVQPIEEDTMKSTILLLAGMALATASSLTVAAAPSASTVDCSRISDVAVPWNVDVQPASVTFTNKRTRVVVSQDAIVANGRTFHGSSVKAYYGDVRNFLGNASSMANVARHFTDHTAFPKAATGMCQAILAVHASGEQVQRAFPGFASPIHVSLQPAQVAATSD